MPDPNQAPDTGPQAPALDMSQISLPDFKVPDVAQVQPNMYVKVQDPDTDPMPLASSTPDGLSLSPEYTAPGAAAVAPAEPRAEAPQGAQEAAQLDVAPAAEATPAPAATDLNSLNGVDFSGAKEQTVVASLPAQDISGAKLEAAPVAPQAPEAPEQPQL